MKNKYFNIENSFKFFTSEKWWKPIISFIFEKCSIFTTNQSKFNEYSIYLEMVSLIENLLEFELCKENNINFQTFEDYLISGLKENNKICINIIELLKKSTNFKEFKNQMLYHNQRIENEVSNTILQFIDDLEKSGEDNLEIMNKITIEIQKKEEKTLNNLINLSCQTLNNLFEKILKENSELIFNKNQIDLLKRKQYYLERKENLKKLDLIKDLPKSSLPPLKPKK